MVVKIGSHTITDEKNQLNTDFMNEIARQVHQNKEWRHLIVSSGAVTAGIPSAEEENVNPNDIIFKQIAVSYGQPRLMRSWKDAFRPFEIPVAQFLFTRKNLERHMPVLKAINNGIVIANGDDTAYSPEEEEDILIKDNDDLAANLAIKLPAQKVLYLSNAGGLRNVRGEIISEVKNDDDLSENIIFDGKSKNGTGGMESKHRFSLELAEKGITVYIAGGNVADVILKAARGENSGTHYVARR